MKPTTILKEYIENGSIVEKEPEYLIRFFFIIFDIKDTIIYLSQIIFHNFHVVFRESDQLQINIITILTYYIFHCLD